jgi:thymidine phosphorylase
MLPHIHIQTGAGAFMREREEAVALAKSMVSAGLHAGKRMVAVLTSMEQPLGRAVGNWFESVAWTRRAAAFSS